MFASDTTLEEALRFSRFDRNHMLASSARPILLEEQEWKSAEHYVHSKIAGTTRLASEVSAAETAEVAVRLVMPWYRMKVKGWKNLRRIYMTRALYTQVQMYEEVRNYLLQTGERLLAESSQYDHYWGIGRDLRGENMLGRVWMDIRKKLHEDVLKQEGEG